MQCAHEHRGANVRCPHCSGTVTVPWAARKFTMPTRTSASREGRRRPSPIVIVAAAALVLGLLSALVVPSMLEIPPEFSRGKLSMAVFLITTGAVLSCVAGLMILINAFQESIWWGLGFFVPVIGGIVSLAFVFMHWSRNGILFLVNLGGTVLAIIGIFVAGAGILGDLEGMAEFQEPDGSSAFMTAGGSTPGETIDGFQRAGRSGDYATAFHYLTPELQNEELEPLVTMIIGARMMKGEPTMKRIGEEGERVLSQHGLPPSKLDEMMQDRFKAALAGGGAPAESQEEAIARLLSSVADKGKLYEDLNKVLKGITEGAEPLGILEGLATSPIQDLEVTGARATAKSVISGDIRVRITLNKVTDAWLISAVDFLDMDKMFERFAENLQNLGANGTGPRSTTAPAVEDRVVSFQRQSALSGNRTAQYDLGMRYLQGNGVERDHEEARRWLKLAADQGHNRAEKELQRLPAPGQ